jgi:hypothetical protein
MNGVCILKKIKKRPLLFVILAVVVVIAVAPFTNVFTKAYANDGSTIAGINIGTKSEDEIRTILADAIASWSQNPPQIDGGGSTLMVDPTTFQFDVDATLSTYDSLMSKSWYAFWESKNVVHIPLELTGTETLKAEIEGIGTWNVEETYALAIQNIANLKSEPIEAVVVDTSILEAERLTFIIEDIPEKAKSVYDIAQFLDGTVIGAGENFSLLERLGGIAENSNKEGLSFVGSLLYRNALHTNTVITERHAQQEIPSYLEPGLEAYVNANTTKDISFKNNGNEPIKMRFTVSGQKLKIEFLSSTITNTVTVKVTQADEVKPRQIVRFTDDLSIGAVRTLQKGEKGARVTVFRVIDGFEEQMSRDFYPPINEVILKSSRQPQSAPTIDGDGNANQNGTTQGEAPNNGSNGSGEDTLDLDNDGLPDINQGDGYEPEVDADGNVVQPDGTTTDKSGNIVSKEGRSS